MEIKLGRGVMIYGAYVSLCASSDGTDFCLFHHTINYLLNQQWSKTDLQYESLKSFLAWDVDNHCWRDE